MTSVGMIYVPILANYTHLRELTGSLAWSMSLAIFELSLICFTLILLFWNMYLFLKRTVFHPNIKLCLYFYYCIDFIMAVLRICYVSMEIAGTVAEDWVFILSTARVLYLLSTVSGMPVFLLERSFATYYGYKYQEMKNLALPIFCLTVPNVLTLLVCGYWISVDNVLATILVAVIISLIGLLGYLFLVHYNILRLKKMISNHTRYSLGNRYQIEENMRTFKALRNAFIIYSWYASFFVLTIVLSLVLESPIIRESLHFTMEIILSTIPAPVFCFFIVSHPSWKYDLKRCLCCGKANKNSLVTPVPHANEMELYFRQLQETWNR